MENIEVMVVLFIIVVLGYAMCKLGYMGDKFDQKLSSIVIDITCPALILSSVMGTELPDRSLILPLLGVGFLGSSDKVRGIPTQIYQRYMIDFP